MVVGLSVAKDETNCCYLLLNSSIEMTLGVVGRGGCGGGGGTEGPVRLVESRTAAQCTA